MISAWQKRPSKPLRATGFVRRALMILTREGRTFFASASAVGRTFGLYPQLYRRVNDPNSGATGDAPTRTAAWTGTHGRDGDHILSNVSQGMDPFLDGYPRLNSAAREQVSEPPSD